MPCNCSTNHAPHLPLQLDKTPTPDPDVRRWPFWIKSAPLDVQADSVIKNGPPSSVKVEPRFISREEVSRHNSASSAYIILDNKVYDVTTFAPNHPGSAKVILLRAGSDASGAFFAFHPPRVRDSYLQVPSRWAAAANAIFILPYLSLCKHSFYHSCRSACALAGVSP
jgi:cytochrome b involved in lipid metabolism